MAHSDFNRSKSYRKCAPKSNSQRVGNFIASKVGNFISPKMRIAAPNPKRSRDTLRVAAAVARRAAGSCISRETINKTPSYPKQRPNATCAFHTPRRTCGVRLGCVVVSCWRQFCSVGCLGLCSHAAEWELSFLRAGLA